MSDGIAAADWAEVAREVDDVGCALLPRLLTPDECAELAALYEESDRFRATIDMQRHRFGQGEYRYFAAPFPEPVQRLRHALYPRLLPIARDWARRLGREAEWPDTLDEWLAICHAAGQTRPTPILLRYETGDWNALHRDLYGEKVFPLQVVINLNDPGSDHTGGEFLLVEQRPRAQSRGTATTIPHGHGSGVHHPRPPGPLGARLVGLAGPARCLHDPLRPAAHPRPRLPRRGLTMTDAELAAVLRLLTELAAETITIGTARDAESRAAADRIAAAWQGQVLDTVDWPETAASWLRQARRFTAHGPDAWVVIARPAGWTQLVRRLGADWDPRRTIVTAPLADTVDGLRRAS